MRPCKLRIDEFLQALGALFAEKFASIVPDVRSYESKEMTSCYVPPKSRFRQTKGTRANVMSVYSFKYALFGAHSAHTINQIRV